MTKCYTNLRYFILFHTTFLQLGLDGDLPSPSALTVLLNYFVTVVVISLHYELVHHVYVSLLDVM